MKAWIEKENPLIDRPGYATVWKYTWDAEHCWYETEGEDFAMVGLPWTKE